MQDALTLTECCHDWRANMSVDSSRRLVENVALAGSQSRNGYNYATVALANCATLYDQKPVFLDHANPRGRTTERSTRDLVGTITRPRFESGKVRGDIQVLDTESGRLFLELVEADAPGIGMSHVVLARRSDDGTIITAIEDVLSVDVVVNPATTTTFRESCQTQAGESAPPPVESLVCERDQLRRELLDAHHQLEQLTRESLISRLLTESSLPMSAVTPLFRRQLQQASDQQSCRELIADREQFISSSLRHRTSPSSLERPQEPSRSHDDEFVRCIRRS